MFKVTQFGKGFSKPINLVWESQVVAPKHNYHPSVGYHGHSGKSQFEEKAFGDIGYALTWLNTNLKHREPDYVSVNGVKSRFREWFTNE